jgi:hypothetical protein
MASRDLNLLHFLSEYRTKSVSQSFDELLADSINIPEGIRATASISHQNLRKFLQEECERDSGFPSILGTADSDFLGGSFARHTKTRPLDDIDIYLPLDGANLFYFDNGVRLPYSVLTDGLGWTPLLTSRWANGLYVSSSKLIEGFASVIGRRFPQTKVKADGQAVSLRMTHGETSTSYGLGYDVVPCFSLSTQNGGHFYLMPDGRDGWIRTNPRYDAAVADLLQKEHNKNFRKTVKILKYWNAQHLDGSLNSYFVELTIARAFWNKGITSDTITTLSYGVALAFWAVQQAVLRGLQDPWIEGAPPVYPGTILAGHLMLLNSDTGHASAAWDDEKANRTVSAASKWKLVFGSRFPD